MASIKLKDYLESLTSKGSISNSDLLPLLDSDSSNELKKITKGNLTNLESISGWTAFSSSVQSTSNTSLKDIVGLGNYTASLKGAIEVSGQNVNVLGMITAQQFNVTYVSSSVQFKSGSTEFGDSIDDTHTITGTIILNGSVLELSQLNNFSSSIRNEINGIEAYTSSLKSKLIVSSSTQIQNYDVFALNSNLYTATGSLIGITNGLMAWTASLDSTYATDAQLLPILQATRSLEILSGSMIGITNGLMAYTASNQTWRSGIRAEIDGIEAWTASLDSIYASDSQLLPLYQATASLNTFSGSLIGITNGLMAFTAALDSTYATDAQLLQLYQATRSLEILSGSLIGITNGLMAFTAGLDSTYATDAQLLPILQATASINLTTGSLIGITNGLMAFTAALDSTYATDAQLLPILQATASLNTFTGSIQSEIGGIEAYTASLKGAAIVSSSQQITNYYKFAETASANTFYGTQTISGSLNVNSSLFVSSSSTFKGNLSIEKVAPNITMKGGYSQDLAFFLNVEPSVYLVDDATATKGMKVNISTGDVSVITGNLVIGTSGKGIDFSATSNSSGTMTSELLNDYEEGTWSPVITDLTNDATMDGTYTRGTYTKIGRQVTVRGYILTTSLGSVTGNVKIKGLPFTNGSGFGSLGGGSIGTASGLNITAGHSVHISTPLGQNHLGLSVGDDAAGTTEMTAAEWSADGQVQMLATYFVD